MMKKTKRLTPAALRGMILQEVRQSHRPARQVTRRHIPTLTSLLFEQDEEAETEVEADVEVGEPKGTEFTNQLNFKGADAKEVAAQILTRDPEQPIFRAMAFTDDEDEVHKPDHNKVADWLEDLGVATFIKRVAAVGAKIPSKGLPKSDMPFLPGPSDAMGTVDQLEDALTPGGEFNVNVVESSLHEINHTFKRGLRYLIEQAEEETEETEEVITIDPPAKNSFIGLDAPGAQEYMTGGLEPSDGKADDDKIGIELGGSFPASAATPTQVNILLPKALGMAAGKGPGQGTRGGDLKAYASIDNEILDGHHRWAATMLNDPGADIKTIAKISFSELGQELTLKHLTAIGNALGNKTKTESRRRRSEDDVIMENWQRLAGLI